MDFGKLADISRVDFSLPSDNPQTIRVLQTNRAIQPAPQIYVGCPVWANKNWVGTFYPPKTKEADFLKVYAQQFNTIELNVTHYQIPTTNTLEKWRKTVPPEFRFCPKFPQEISHQLLPQGKAGELTHIFCEAIRGLGENLGTSFLQLPPTFSPREYAQLESFLASFPNDITLAIEFRHPDWFKGDNFENVAELLENQGISTVITDVSGRRDVLHLRLTQAVAMLRFVGNDLHPSDFARVDTWVQRFKIWLSEGLQTIYFFAHEPNNDDAPMLAKYFLEQLNLHQNLQLKIPKSYQIPKQGDLFG
ncbi:MAG: DUF72 domain-containing protein [Microscillaceae bacterium]|jgi:uncharacterized protein YecE (DUF72 family)|nr:DUF72 domain-containing protein [Microscillaceae bacterium]